MTKAKHNTDHKVVTTETDAPSTSAHVTIESSGTVGDGKRAFFPAFHEEKGWSSKTDRTINLEVEKEHDDVL